MLYKTLVFVLDTISDFSIIASVQVKSLWRQAELGHKRPVTCLRINYKSVAYNSQILKPILVITNEQS